MAFAAAVNVLDAETTLHRTSSTPWLSILPTWFSSQSVSFSNTVSLFRPIPVLFLTATKGISKRFEKEKEKGIKRPMRL